MTAGGAAVREGTLFIVSAPSGAGKTFTALRLATGLGGTIAVIDTERGSASKYADRFDFDVLDLEHAAIPSYEGAIEAAATGSLNSEKI